MFSTQESTKRKHIIYNDFGHAQQNKFNDKKKENTSVPVDYKDPPDNNVDQ